jgi:hypothetical protein
MQEKHSYKKSVMYFRSKQSQTSLNVAFSCNAAMALSADSLFLYTTKAAATEMEMT